MPTSTNQTNNPNQAVKLIKHEFVPLKVLTKSSIPQQHKENNSTGIKQSQAFNNQCGQNMENKLLVSDRVLKSIGKEQSIVINSASPLLVLFMKAKLRSSSWWIRFFVQTGLDENETAGKKFEQASVKKAYKPACQVFHLKSYP